MLKYFLFLTNAIIIAASSVTSPKILFNLLHNNLLKRVYITPSLGNPKYKDIFILDMVNRYPIHEIPIKNELPESKTLHIISEDYSSEFDEGIKGLLAEDQLKMTSLHDLITYSFMLISKEDSPFKAVETLNSYILLSRSKWSLVSQWYEQQYITKKMFQFINYTLIIGGLFYHEDINDYFKIDINTNERNSWASNIRSIQIDDHKQIKPELQSTKIFFNTFEVFLVFPYSYYDYFEQYFFNDYNIQVFKENETDTLIMIKDKIINKGTEVKINFSSGLGWVLWEEKLFTYFGREMRKEFLYGYWFKILFRKNIDFFIIGGNLLEDLNAVFNEDEEYIAFNNKTGSVRVNNEEEDNYKGNNYDREGKKNNSTKYLIIIAVIVILIGLGITITTKLNI